MYIVSDGARFVISTLDRLLTKTTFVETEVTFVDKSHFEQSNMNYFWPAKLIFVDKSKT